MKIIVTSLLIVQFFILNPHIISAQSEVESDPPIIRTIVPPAIASQEQTGGAQFYQNQSLSPETAFGLTVLAVVFLATGFAILKVKTSGEHNSRLSDRRQYAYAQQL